MAGGDQRRYLRSNGRGESLAEHYAFDVGAGLPRYGCWQAQWPDGFHERKAAHLRRYGIGVALCDSIPAIVCTLPRNSSLKLPVSPMEPGVKKTSHQSPFRYKRPAKFSVAQPEPTLLPE